MKKLVSLMLALAMTLCLGLALAEDSSIAVCIASEPDTLDPALNSAVDGATVTAHLFVGLSTWAQDENGALQIVPAAAEALTEPVINEDGTATYTYTLKSGMLWSDGQPVKASDFAFAWKRAASSALGADYGYMFEGVKGYPDELAVETPDDNTIVVTLNNALSYWDELLAFPAFFPVREDVVANEAWATDPATYVCNGPYTMTGWESRWARSNSTCPTTPTTCWPTSRTAPGCSSTTSRLPR